MKKIQILLIILFIIPMCFASKFTIQDYTRVDYNQHDFTNCNPCPLTIDISDERNKYDEVMFRFNANFDGTTGRETRCINVAEMPSALARQPCTILKSSTYICQYYGYQDSGVSCFGSCSIGCFKNVMSSTEWVEIRYDDYVLTGLTPSNPIADVNIASIVNSVCDGMDLCNAKLDFKVYSEKNVGSWDVSDQPINMKVRVNTITIPTTTTTIPIIIGECSLRNPDPCFVKLFRNIIEEVKNLIELTLNILTFKL